MSIKRDQNYHTVHAAQVEPRLFDSFWKRVLRDRSREAALFAEDGAILRTFQDVEEERAEWRAQLSGFSAGDGVVGALGNDPSWPAFLLAGWDRALVIAPIEPDIPEAQLDRILELIQARGLVRARSGIECFDRPQVAWDGPKPDLLKITSGTTGAPRAVRFRESQLLADCRNICETMGIRPEDRELRGHPILAFVWVQQPDHAPALSGNRPDLLNGSDATSGLSSSSRTLEQRSFLERLLYFRRLDRYPAPQNPSPFASVFRPARPWHLRFRANSTGVSVLRSTVFTVLRSAAASLTIATTKRQSRTDLPAHPWPELRSSKSTLTGSAVRGPNVADGYFPDSDADILDGTAILSRGPRRMVKSGNTSRWSCHRIRECRRKEGSPIRRRRTSPENAWGYRCNRLRNSVGNPQRRFGRVCRGSKSLSRQLLESHCREGLSSWQVPREIQIVPELPFNNRGKINRSELSKLHVESHGA